jgi:uncharacterized protein YcbK (DUF882 family)
MIKNFLLLFFVFFCFNFNTAQAKVYFESDGIVVVKDEEQKIYQKSTTNYSKKRYSKKRPKGKVSRTGTVKFKGHRMPASVANKLRELESMFGKIRIISSCRKGARVRKTGRPSMHSYCRAVDFIPPRGYYWKVAIWLKLTWSGGVGTYSGRFNHIHIDDNRGRWHN